MPSLKCVTNSSDTWSLSRILSSSSFNEGSVANHTFLMKKTWDSHSSINSRSPIFQSCGCGPPGHHTNRFGSGYVRLIKGLAARIVAKSSSSGHYVFSAHIHHEIIHLTIPWLSRKIWSNSQEKSRIGRIVRIVQGTPKVPKIHILFWLSWVLSRLFRVQSCVYPVKRVDSIHELYLDFFKHISTSK